MKNLIFICFLAISSSLFSQGNGNGNGSFLVNVSGDWTTLIISKDDITDAGNDYNKDFYSNIDQTKITITSTFQNQPFTVSIYKEGDIPYPWPSGLDLQITQTSSSDPTTPITSPQSDSRSIQDYSGPLLFHIQGSKTNQMTFKYKIKGVSVLMPVQAYTTTIVFTVWQE